MKTRLFIFWQAVAIVCTLNQVFAQTGLLTSSESVAIDNYIESEMEDRQIPGLALAISYKGKPIKVQAYGLTDVQNQAPVQIKTAFELASLTKQFTAAAIMILVQEGKLELDIPLHQYLPDAPAGWKGVTVRQLLTHTSGLPALSAGFSGIAKMQSELLASLISLNIPTSMAYKAVLSDTLDFAPGSRFSYSDVGYFLLGYIIEKVSGMSYRAFMAERIFKPSNLHNTYLLDQKNVHPYEARGYTIQKGKLVNIQRVFDFELPSHYGIFSTVEDLARWDAVLYSDKVLTSASKEQMWKAVRLNDGSTQPYGFGWFVRKINNHFVTFHTGITGTEIVRLPHDSLSVIVLTNLGSRLPNDLVRAWELAQGVAKIIGYNLLTGSNYTTADGATVLGATPKLLEQLLGTYVTATSTFPIQIEKGSKDSQYRLIYPTGNWDLAPLSNGRFLALNSSHEYVLEPVRNLNGQIAGIKLHKNGQWLATYTRQHLSTTKAASR